MATINLGAIKFNWKGAYNSGTTYAVEDVVSSGGNSYVCIQAHSTAQAVGNATAYWNIMSSAGTNGTNGTDLTSTLTTRGDIVYKGASALTRLPKGTAGYVLKQGANDPEWGEASGGAWEKLGEVEHSGSSVASVDINFTPDDSVYKWYQLLIQDWRGNGGNPYWRIKTGGSTQTGNIYTSGGSGTANTGSAGWHDQRRDDTSDNRLHFDQTWTVYTSADYGQAYHINFYKGSATQKKQFFGTHQIIHNAHTYVGAGYMGYSADNSSALTGFTFFQSSGNIDKLNAYVLGFKA